MADKKDPDKSQLDQLAQAAANGDDVVMESKDSCDRQTLNAFRLISKIKKSFVDAGEGEQKPNLIEPGDRWGHLTVMEEIGAGGMGLVFNAFDDILDRPVALKFLNPKSNSYISSEVFIAEARRLAKVRHPNVLAVHGANTFLGITGFWSELIEGECLDSYVEHGLDWQQVLKLSQNLSQALKAIHENQIVHGDIKPLNIMIDEAKGAILMDFGSGNDLNKNINQVSSSTPLIMAPELFQGMVKSKQSDVYALGVVFYYLSTGGLYPHNSNTFEQLSKLVVDRHDIDFKLIKGPKNWSKLIQSMLNHQPNKRPTAEQTVKKIDEMILAPAKRIKKILIYSLIIFLFSTTLILSYSYYTLDKAQNKTQKALKETSEVNLLMSDMLSSVSPVVKGKDVLMVDVIDHLVVDTQNNESISANVKAQSLLTLAFSLNGLGQSSKAISMMETLAMDPGINDKLKIEVLCAHVLFLMKQNNDIETAQLAQGLVNQAKLILNGIADNPLFLEALILHGQAQIDLALNDWMHAEININKALHYWQSIKPSKSINRHKGILFNDLGLIASSQSQFDKATDYYQSAAENFESFGQTFNSNILGVNNNLAINLRKTGHLEEAIKLYKELVIQAETYIGTDHLIYWSLMQNLAGALNDADRIDESIEILEAISPQIIEVYGTQSKKYISIRTTLANNLKSLRNFEAAEEIYQEIIGISKQLFNDNHSEVLINQYNLAELYYESGAPEKAVDLLENRLPVAIEALGEKHIISMYMLEAMGWSYYLLDQPEKAIDLVSQAAELKKSVYGSESEITIKAQLKQAEVAAALKHL